MNRRSPALVPGDDSEQAETLAAMCKALGHPARIKILRHLLAENRCICGRIVEVLPLAQSTVSQHLKILKSCGLVMGEIEGPRTCYCVDRQKLAAMIESIQHIFSQPAQSTP